MIGRRAAQLDTRKRLESVERAIAARNMVMELLLADQPARETAHDPQSKFWQWADRMGVAASRLR